VHLDFQLKLSASKKAISVKVKPAKKVTGYTVRYSISQKMKNAKLVNSKKTTIKIKGLKSKKVYYVQARTYVKSGEKVATGHWTKADKIKVK